MNGSPNQPARVDSHRSSESGERRRIGEWQPIETAPKDMRSILVFVVGASFGSLQEEPDMIHIAFWKRDGFRLQDEDHFIVEPTHWMPLPLGPHHRSKIT